MGVWDDDDISWIADPPFGGDEDGDDFVLKDDVAVLLVFSFIAV